MFRFLFTQYERFQFALWGFASAHRKDQHFKLLIIGGVGYFLFSYIFWPLTEIEFWVLWGSYALLLVTELQNTALETALDKLHPEPHEDIGASKDIASASSLVALITTVAAVVWIFVVHTGL